MLLNGADYLHDDFIVFLGDGKGNFAASNEPVPGTYAHAITAADFNNDGNLDLAIASGAISSSTALQILLGDGHGSFTPKSATFSGPIPTSLIAGDFNGDGRPDVAVLNEYPGEPASPASVSLFLGNGDGTLTIAAAVVVPGAASQGPANLVAADFNRDGKLDLSVSGAGSVAVILGNGNGTFRSPISFPAAAQLVTAGDINGDGVPDLLLSGSAYQGDDYLIGNGDGTFQSAVPIAASASQQIGLTVAADFNRDGRIDFAGLAAPLGVNVLLNMTPPPAFTLVSSATFAIGPAAPESLVTAFGKNLTTATASAPSSTLPLTLGGTSVTVGGAAAPLLYVSPSQINFEIPPGIPNGVIPTAITANVVITTPNGTTLSAPLTIQPVAPSIFIQDASGLALAGLVSITDGVQTITAVNGPISLAPDSVYLILYGTGLRGAAGNVTANIQGIDAPVSYAGAQPDFPGLDQVNIPLPKSIAGAGLVSIVVTAGGLESNTVQVSIQ